MIIDKIIVNCLPICFRNVGIFSLIRRLLTPVKELQVIFLAWKSDKKKSMTITPQLIVLQKLLNDQTGLTVNIENYNGVHDNVNNYDFKVMVTSPTTDQQNLIKKLLNSYKIAGKSFIIVDNTYVVGFTIDQNNYASQFDRVNNLTVTQVKTVINSVEVVTSINFHFDRRFYYNLPIWIKSQNATQYNSNGTPISSGVWNQKVTLAASNYNETGEVTYVISMPNIVFNYEAYYSTEQSDSDHNIYKINGGSTKTLYKIYYNITVTKTKNGNAVSGYPKSYSLLAAFDSYPSLSENSLNNLSDEDMIALVNAFCLYIERQESGLSVSSANFIQQII